MSGYVKGTTVTGEMEVIRAAFNRAITAAYACPNPDQAFRDVTALGSLGKQITSEAGDFRAWMAANLVDANALSLAQLAGHLGVSKGRAAQLVDIGRERGNTVTDPGTDPEPSPVAAAIITSDLGPSRPGRCTPANHQPTRSPGAYPKRPASRSFPIM